MRGTVAVVFAMLMSGPASADFKTVEQAIVGLAPLQGAQALEVEETRTVSGRCGGAVIRVFGMTGTVGNVFKAEPPGGLLVVEGVGRRKHLLLGDAYLSDYNYLRCFKTGQDERLLLRASCAGSGAGRTPGCDTTFFVIDPQQAVVLAPKLRPPKGACDAKCAATALGIELPPDVVRP